MMEYLLRTDLIVDMSCLVLLAFLTRLGIKDRKLSRAERLDQTERIHHLEEMLDAHITKEADVG